MDDKVKTIRTNKTFWFAIATLWILSFAFYLQDLNYEYVLDDKMVITGNTFTKKGYAGIYDIFTTESFTGYFGEQKNILEGSRYRPLSIATFAIERSLFGNNRQVLHFINILLYAMVCSLVYVFFLRISPPGSQKWFLTVAFIGALLYTIHPLHTEVVANIKGRDEILALLFSLATLLSSLAYIRNGKAVYLFLSFMYFLLALLGKENAITFLAIIPLTILVFHSASIKKLAVIFIPLSLATFIYFIMRYQAIGFLFSGTAVASQDIMNYPFANMDFLDKYATIFYTLGLYIKLNIFPHPLTHDYYPFHIPQMSWGNWQSIISLLLHIGLFIFSIFQIKKRKTIAYGILFYLICLSIVSNIFVSVGTFMNERFMFFSSVGAVLVFAKLFWNGFQSTRKPIQILSYSLLGIMLIGYSYKTITRIPVWQNALTLNTAGAEVSINSARANTFLATALYNKIKDEKITGIERTELLAKAEKHVDIALKLYPSYQNANIMKAGMVTEHFRTSQNLDELLSAFKKIAIVQPSLSYLNEYYEYLNTRGYDTNKLVNYYYDLGFNELYAKQHKYRWAIKYMQYALKLDPQNTQVMTAMSKAYRAIGMEKEANDLLYSVQQIKQGS